MKSSLVLLLLASTLVVGCAGTNPLAPDAALASNQKSATTSAGSPTLTAFLPPINPAGISCPSDAPEIVVGSLGMRMDIEFSEVTGAKAYEIEIINNYGEKTRVEVQAPAHRAEWYGLPGLYRVRVRTLNCGGVGNWSVEVLHSLHDVVVPQPEPPVEPPSPSEPKCVHGCEPPPPPQCMTGCL